MNSFLEIAASASRWLPKPIKSLTYKLGPATELLRAALNRAAPTGIVETRIASGYLRDTRIFLDLHKEKTYWLGTYEPTLENAVLEFVNPGDIVYDIGANIGYTALLFAKKVGPTGKVIAFEPLPQNIVRIKSNSTLNPQFQIESHQCAISDHEGEASFLVHESNGMGKIQGAAGRDEQYANTIEVPCTSLDDFILEQEQPAPMVIKVDIEGGEVLAMPGMRETLSEFRPILIIELHGEQAARTVWNELLEQNYNIARLRQPSEFIHSVEDLDWKEYIIARPITNS